MITPRELMRIFECCLLLNVQKYSNMQNTQGKKLDFFYGLKDMSPLTAFISLTLY